MAGLAKKAGLDLDSIFPWEGSALKFKTIQILYRGGSDGVDYDEMAWELEKCVTYHYIATKPQIIVNEEATMARKGLDPVSRKTKTPGRKKSGFCVYLAYQLIDSVTHDQARSNS